jgi:hypothetical protein
MDKCTDKKPFYNPKTKRCVTDNVQNRKRSDLIDTRKKIKSIKQTEKKNKTMKKSCPPKKPLYNPITNRCVTDNALNRKKLGLIDTRVLDLDKSPELIKKTTPKTITVKAKDKKVCPSTKPLYNPITNRCVTDNALNRRKIGLIPLSKTRKNKQELTLTTPSLTKKSLNIASLERMIPVNLSQKTYTNIWYGSGLRQLMGLYYLYTKHKSVMCFVPQIVDTPSKLARSVTNGFLFTTYKNASESQYNNYVNLLGRESPIFRKKYKDSTLEMRVHSSFKLKELIQKCKRQKKRFFIGYIVMEEMLFNSSGKYSQYSSAHANSFIYDTKLETLEIFEPHGELSSDYNIKYGEERNYVLQRYFIRNNVNVKELLSSADFCPRRKGPQMYDVLSNKKYINSNQGYCAAWSIFYLDMRLKYPNEDRTSLMSKILSTFSVFTKEYINEYAKTIINTTIQNIPYVNRYMSDKERLKRFNDLSDNSFLKRRDETIISREIFNAINSCEYKAAIKDLRLDNFK